MSENKKYVRITLRAFLAVAAVSSTGSDHTLSSQWAGFWPCRTRPRAGGGSWARRSSTRPDDHGVSESA